MDMNISFNNREVMLSLFIGLDNKRDDQQFSERI